MVAVTAVTVVTLALASATTLFLVRRDELIDLDRALVTRARLAVRLLSTDDPARFVRSPGSVDLPEQLEPGTEYVAVYAADGTLLAASPSLGPSPPRLPRNAVGAGAVAALDLEVDGEPLRAVVLPVPASRQILLYGASRAEVVADVAFLARVLLGLLAAATGATILVASWVGRRLSSDVLDLAGVARAVASGDLGARTGGRVRGSAETAALAADLDDMIQKLATLVMAQRTFISHAAHELMSPLTTLRGELQLALRRPRSVAEHEETLAQALRDVEALVTLSEDLLALARAETRAASEHDTPIGEVVAEALRMARGAADARGVRVREEVEGDRHVRVRGVCRELARALRNLVDNGVLHSERGGEVLIRVSMAPGSLQVSVEDHGPGVPRSERSQIFEPFFRGARDRGETDQGAGLGLSIAREIARRFGGDVVLDEAQGPGARFVLRLARAP
jgi:two-component system OmpR family sensor kinase